MLKGIQDKLERSLSARDLQSYLAGDTSYSFLCNVYKKLFFHMSSPQPPSVLLKGTSTTIC